MILGFCIGSLLALETACVLADRGTPVDLVILVDPPTRDLATKKIRFPNVVRHPVRFMRTAAERGVALHRPFANPDPVITRCRVLRRHAVLIDRHPPRHPGGPIVIIQSEEYAARKDPEFVESAFSRNIPRLVIPGTHRRILMDPERLSIAITHVLRDSGLV